MLRTHPCVRGRGALGPGGKKRGALVGPGHAHFQANDDNVGLLEVRSGVELVLPLPLAAVSKSGQVVDVSLMHSQ